MLTQQQIDQYRDEGYVLVSGLFDEDELDRLEEAFDGIIDRRVAARAPVEGKWGGEKWQQRYGAADTVFIHTHDLQAYSAEWTRWLVHDRMTEALSDAMGSANIQLHHTKLFQKPPEKGTGFPMHQDYPYFPHTRHTMMAAVIHLTDADEEMGCIRVYPGSHKLGPIKTWEHHHLDPDEYPIEGATPCPARRGDLLIFNYLTVHGSGLNLSPRTRKTVLVQVRDPDDKPTTETHRSHAQGMMLRGINPLKGQETADGTLGSKVREVAAETERLNR